MRARRSSEGTPWCLTCQTILTSESQTFCSQCQREWDAARKRRRSTPPTINVPSDVAEAIHAANDVLGAAAWSLRVSLDAQFPPAQKIADIQRQADALVLATKDLAWLIAHHIDDPRDDDARDTAWRRHLPHPAPEPE